MRHENTDLYQATLDLDSIASDVIRRMPRGAGRTKSRSFEGVVAIAEM